MCSFIEKKKSSPKDQMIGYLNSKSLILTRNIHKIFITLRIHFIVFYISFHFNSKYFKFQIIFFSLFTFQVIYYFMSFTLHYFTLIFFFNFIIFQLSFHFNANYIFSPQINPNGVLANFNHKTRVQFRDIFKINPQS